MKIINVIASTPQPPSNTGVSVTLDNTSVFFTVLLSLTGLATVGWSTIFRINKAYIRLEAIEKAIKEQNEYLHKIEKLDRQLELHVQEYVNRKDVVQMVLGQLNEKIDHKFRRTLFYTRDVQRFLQRTTEFKIREYEETTQPGDE